MYNKARLAVLLAGLILCYGGSVLAQQGHRGGGGFSGGMGAGGHLGGTSPDHMRQGGQGRTPSMDQGRSHGSRGLDRADEAASEHGAAGQSQARWHGS